MKQKKIIMRIVTVGIARGGQIDFLELSHVHVLCLRLAFATTLERCDHNHEKVAKIILENTDIIATIYVGWTL